MSSGSLGRDGFVQSPYAGEGAPAGVACRGRRGAGPEARAPEAVRPGPVETRAGSSSCQVRAGRGSTGVTLLPDIRTPWSSGAAGAGTRPSPSGPPGSSGLGTARKGAADVRGPPAAAGTGGSGRRERGTWCGASAPPPSGARNDSPRLRPDPFGRSLRSSAGVPPHSPPGASVRRRPPATGVPPGPSPSLPDAACLPTVSKSNRCNSQRTGPRTDRCRCLAVRSRLRRLTSNGSAASASGRSTRALSTW